MSGDIVGVGVDVADVRRFERLMLRGASQMWAHWYTEAETQECAAAARPAVATALRFAVKEATYKAVGARFSGVVRWRDIEVLGGDPDWRLTLYGEVAAAAATAGVEQFHVSTSRMDGRVMAMVTACTDHDIDHDKES